MEKQKDGSVDPTPAMDFHRQGQDVGHTCGKDVKVRQ